MAQTPTTEDEPQNSRAFLAPPPGLSNPPNGAMMSLDGDPNPLRIGVGGAMPNGVRPGPQPSKGPR
jgi:hypothetical protein